MADQTNVQKLRDLARDSRLLELDHFVPPLQIIRALGVERNEIAHSRLLAALLNPRQHRGAEIMLRSLLQSILRQQYLAGSIGERLQGVLGTSWTNVAVQREFQFIDIVVQIATSHHTVVIGIENKIDAGEGNEQLGRYQNALERAFPTQTSVMVFLTPTGREPTTAISHGRVPAFSAGYDLIVEAVEETLQRAAPNLQTSPSLGSMPKSVEKHQGCASSGWQRVRVVEN